jgi:DNA-binding IclR family transcriptional regulator
MAGRRADTDGNPERSSAALSAAPPARGVLGGAFAVLDALTHADDGLGLTALARASGLAKTSAHRLAEQLVGLGAVQCVERRYYIGQRMERIGQCWQPDPLLRRSAKQPVHALAVHSRAAVALQILHEHRLRFVCAAAPRGHDYVPAPSDTASIAHTAAGRVLYAGQPAGDVALPDCWSRREWRNLRRSIRDPDVTVLDRQDAVPGICCVSAPVWRPTGICAGAVTVLVQANNPPPGLARLVLYAARRIEATLQQPHRA